MVLVRATTTVLSLLVLGGVATAARDIQGVRSLGMGGTLRAAPGGANAPVLNPAAMSLMRTYVLGGNYQYRGSDAASLVNASIVDSITAKVAAGLYYNFAHASPDRTLALPGGAFKLDEQLVTHEVGLALSLPLGQVFALGLTGKYVNIQGELPENAPEGLRTADVSTVTVDVAGMLRLADRFFLGAVGYNLGAVEDTTFPRSLGLGVAAQLSLLLLEFDTVLDFSSAESVKPSFHGGAELTLDQKYSLRTGVQHDRLREATYVSGGLGLSASKLGLDFGLRQMVAGGAETLIGFSLQLLMQAM